MSIYSDDNGQQWQYGDELPLPYQWSGTTLKTLEPSEADMVELLDGRLLMTVRLDFNQVVAGVNYGPRYQFVSNNGGETWSMLNGNGANVFANISTGTVDAAITRIEQNDGSSYLAFTNPIGDLTTHAGRTNLGLWLSFDEGQTWKGPLQLVSGGSAYSDIIQINDSQMMVILRITQARSAQCVYRSICYASFFSKLRPKWFFTWAIPDSVDTDAFNLFAHLRIATRKNSKNHC